MVFSEQVKQEISAREIDAPCCVNAACYGIACFSRVFTLKTIEFHTEKVFVAKWAKDMFAKAGIQGKVYVKGEQRSSYVFSINNPYEAEKTMALFGHTGEETSVRIRRENLACEGCSSAFTAAAFLCAGTVVSPEKGYNLEFISPRHKLMEDFAAVLQDCGFAPKMALRKGTHLLYFRASEQIEDLLTFMGAGKSTLELMHLKVYKDFRNSANRITNCETANIDKSIAASQSTIRAIQKLTKQNRITTLPEPLQKAAKLRLAYPDFSLAELAQKAEEPISRSALSLRFKKIRECAEAMMEEEPTSP